MVTKLVLHGCFSHHNKAGSFVEMGALGCFTTNPTMNLWTFIAIRRRRRALRGNKSKLVRFAFV